MSELWLNGPSELAIEAIKYIYYKFKPNKDILSILDVGCGNGRDAFYFSDNIECRILGIDISKDAIEIALNKVIERQMENVNFQICNFLEFKDGKYDIIFSSGVYHFLKKDERIKFRKRIIKLLKPKGLLFLSTLSVGDSYYYGKGTPVHKESNSFLYEYSAGKTVYLHFSNSEELIKDFSFLDIKELFEHKEHNPHVKGPINYIPWIMIGENK